MSEIKVGSVVRLKSDTFSKTDRYLTVTDIANDQLSITGFKSDGSVMQIILPIQAVDLVLV